MDTCIINSGLLFVFLFPITAGDSTNIHDLEGRYDKIFKDRGSFSKASAVYGRSNSRDNMECTSGSVVDSDHNFSLESRSNSYAFLGDVNSLAWGICGDAYNQHKDTSFRELLFVSGNHGVTVHAFSHQNRSSEMSRTALEGDFGQGRWVEWGPSSTLAQNMELQEPSSLCCDHSGDVMNVSNANGNNEVPHNYSEAEIDLSRGIASKKWFRSFFTEVESIKSDGKMRTLFPDNSSFPCSAEVVSFSLFNSNSPLWDFDFNGKSLSNKIWQETVLDLENDLVTKADLASSISNSKSDVLSNIYGVGVNSSHRCSKVFSSSSHHLIGFVLMSVNAVSANTRDGNEKSRSSNLLLVARLESWGIQWVSLVKLEGSTNVSPVVEWTDFCFSDNLLVCLNASGLIFFYAAMTGDYVACVDVLQTCGFSPKSDLLQKEKLSAGVDMQINSIDEVHEKSTYQRVGFGGRTFKRLLVDSHTSLLAVADEYGVIYLIHAGDYLLDDYYTSEKLLPHFQHLGLGMLVGWEVGGSDIGHQRVGSSCSSYLRCNISPMMEGKLSCSDNIGSNVFKKIQELNLHGKRNQYESCLSGFSAASKTTDQSFCGSEVRSHILRKILLSTCRFDEDDCICFSPLGITRFIKKHHRTSQKGSQIIHFDLHTRSAVHDDSCLNGEKIFYSQWREEAFVGEAVGCTFQGCFYLVTEGGLSVVFPSVSVSSNFLPVEMVGCRQSGITKSIGYQARDSLEINESNQPWPLWKLEVLDRVLLYDSPEEADRLCLENGESNWNSTFL